MDETKTTPDVANPAATTVDTAVAETKQTDEPLLSKREVVELRKEMRAVLDAVKWIKEPVQKETKQETKPEPKSDDAAKALSEIGRLRSELAFERAAVGAGISDPKQRATLEKIFSVDKPADVGKWMEETMASLGIQTKKQAEPPAQAPAQSNSGAPAVGRPAFVPGQSLLEADPALIKSMPPDELLKNYKAYIQAKARDSNPWKKQGR